MADAPSAKVEALIQHDSPYTYPDDTAVDDKKKLQPFTGSNAPSAGGTGIEGAQ